MKERGTHNRLKAFYSRRFAALLLFTLIFPLAACDVTTRHKVLTTLFDGVPSLPPPEELCSEYVKNRDTQKTLAKAKTPIQVVHPPYEEKRCNDCHSENKDSQEGFVRPLNELCFVCHPDILKHRNVHGPAAVGDCLACHLPHSSSFAALLVAERETLCDRCHSEQRLAKEMHDRVRQQGITCADCHDPHSGNSKFFLK